MRILDLYCGVGGASVGIHHSFPKAEIVGVDLKPQPRYPFTFIQGNALTYDVSGYDFIWSSPPCQHYTGLLKQTDRNKHVDLIEATRRKLVSSGSPYVIENVVNAPVRCDLLLCGEMFGLRVIRHRLFEMNFKCIQPDHITHRGVTIRALGDSNYYLPVYGNSTGKPLWGMAMGMVGHEWIRGLPTYKEISQSVPPAYSRYIMDNFKCPSGQKYYYIPSSNATYLRKSKEKVFFRSVSDARLRKQIQETDLNLRGVIPIKRPLFKKKKPRSKKERLREMRERIWGDEISLVYKSPSNR